MIINHNISALNSNRMFSNNVKRMEGRIENLSTGQRINKGADDAAGLAISEKMRAQVRGLNQAAKNIQDASSLVQTTEGHLAESNDVLQRMRELAVQSANGTYTAEDRAQITVELDEMVKELNRIHEDSKFNTMRLLDGASLRQNSFEPDIKGTATAPADRPRNINFGDPASVGTFVGTDVNDLQIVAADINGLVVQSGANTDERMFVKINAFNTSALGLTGTPDQDYQTLNGTTTNTNQAWRERSFYESNPIDLDQAMYLESALSNVRTDVTINNLTPATTTNITRVDATTTEKATETITVLDVALNKVNKQRADLGAFQNRLEKALGGVENASENLQAAESRIRDANMASEFIEFTKEQILSQSSASMTAQANMRSQLVMRILG
jgi:flagellin